MVLKIVRLPVSRYHAWRRAARRCGLDDQSSCPRSSPHKLTLREVATIKDMVLDPALRHMPLTSLSLFAQRIGRVFASVGSWARLIRARGWLRPRHRVYPDKPTLGVRATKPNELWHIDVTILRLLDGTKAYIHAVIDNYSRKILAWTVANRLDPAATCQVLVTAKRYFEPAKAGAAGEAADSTLVYSDSGVENVNHLVHATLLDEGLRLMLAQVEVTFSNSMIEAFWRSLKHGWLYLNPLDSLAHLRKLVAFFVDEYNTTMPHSAFRGQTPDEMYFGTAKNLEDELDTAREKALERRMAANRVLSCHRCSPGNRMPVDADRGVPSP
jgi:transposase InsO family protein